MNQSQLTDFATRYAADWSSQKPDRVAAFYAADGSLSVNAGAPSVGRAAITATAQGFMAAFPDMVVKMDAVHGDGSHATFRWIWTGTNTGPGGHWQVRSGRGVRGMDDWWRWPDPGVEGALRRGGVSAPVAVRRASRALISPGNGFLAPCWATMRWRRPWGTVVPPRAWE